MQPMCTQIEHDNLLQPWLGRIEKGVDEKPMYNRKKAQTICNEAINIWLNIKIDHKKLNNNGLRLD